MSYEEDIAFGVQQMLDADLQFPQEVPVRKVVKTNADHIRSMTDEELARVMCNCDCPPNKRGMCCEETGCEACWLEHLKQPYKEET